MPGVAVDAPPTIGHNILRAIATVTKSHVTHAIYSHHHADHTGAMILYQGARFYAQSEVAGLLRQTREDPNRPLPDVTFDDQLTVHAGEDRVELAYHGPNQPPATASPTCRPSGSSCSSMSSSPAGCPPRLPRRVAEQSEDGWKPRRWRSATRSHTFIGGHLTRLGTRDNVVIQQEYVADLKAQAASAIDTFNVADVYKSVDPTNPWAIFRAYLDGVAAQAANAVVPRWIDRLGGAASTPCPTPTNSLSRCGSTTATSARSGSIPNYHRTPARLPRGSYLPSRIGCESTLMTIFSERTMAASPAQACLETSLTRLDDDGRALLFTEARTANTFSDRPVTGEQLRGDL